MKARLLELIKKIEDRLAVVIDQTSGENLSFELNERVNLLSVTPELMELASKVYSEKKLQVANEMIFDDRKLTAKQQVQMLYISGQLKEEEGLYTRAERCVKALDKSIEGIRSLLSYDKSMTKF